MADSTTNLPQLSASQSNQEARLNEVLDAASVGTYFGRNAATTTGLTWGFLGGKLLVDGTETAVANGTVTLTASTTNFVQVSRAGVVSTAVTRNPLLAPLYSVVTGTATVSSYTDERDINALARLCHGETSIALTTANVTLTQQQALCETLTVTGALTAVRDLVVPLVRRRWVVRHTGTAFGVRIIGATGTGITVGIGLTATVECDGTNVFRVTADV
jgi:hypothetical protein